MEEQSLSEFLSWRPEYPEAILDQGLMYAGTKTIIYGRYKSMKSMLIQRFALCVANGEPWLGFNTPAEGASVFYLQCEIPHRLLQKRMMTMTGGRPETKKELIVWTEHSIKLDTIAGMSRLEKKLDKHQPQVLIIDPIYKVLTGDMKEQGQISAFLDNMDRLIDKYQITIVLISHSRKSVGDPNDWGTDDMLGSVFFSAWPDSVVQVTKDHNMLNVKFDVARHAEDDISPVVIEIDKQLKFQSSTLKLK